MVWATEVVAANGNESGYTEFEEKYVMGMEGHDSKRFENNVSLEDSRSIRNALDL